MPATSDNDTSLMANAIRALAMDAVQQANSGHPGAPMGMAEMAVALWGRHLKFNPADPHWADRDRFVLSNGHASMLLYAVLHLSGYALPLDELKHAAKIVRAHHERFDGQGYPDGIAGEDISIGARILAIANDYDGLQSGTLSERRMSPEERRQLRRQPFRHADHGELARGVWTESKTTLHSGHRRRVDDVPALAVRARPVRSPDSHTGPILAKAIADRQLRPARVLQGDPS